jgi:hypothetical protein
MNPRGCRTVGAEPNYNSGVRFTMTPKTHGRLYVYHSLDEFRLLNIRSRLIPPLKFVSRQMVPTLQRRKLESMLVHTALSSATARFCVVGDAHLFC